MKNFIKKNIKLLTVLGVVILLSVVGATLALTLRFASTSIGVSTANIVVNVRYEKDGSNNDITSITSNGDLLPTTLDTSSITNVINSTDVVKYKFWVSGSSSNPNNSIYDISLSNIVIDCELKSTYVKWLLYKNNTLLANGNFSPTFDTMPNNRMVLTSTQQDLTTTEDEYLLALYIEESCTGNTSACTSAQSQTSLLGKSFSANIGIDTATKTKKTNTRTTSTEEGCVLVGTTVAKPVCNESLVYDGTSQLLFTAAVPTGVTVNQSTATEPGEYTVTAKLASGLKWSDDTTGDYVFTCSVGKRPVTIVSLNQTGFVHTDSPTYVSSTGLITGHTVNSIKLTAVATVDGPSIIIPSGAMIYDSGNNDITNYYNINYQSLGKEVLYTQVEYIESTGTQYIDTGFKHNQNTRILADIDFQPTKAYVSPFGSWGGENTSPQKRYGGQTNANNNGINLYYGSRGALSINTPATYTGRKTWDFNKNVFTIGGTSKTFSAQTFQSQFNDYIFGISSYNGSFYGGTNMKLYSFKIYNNGTLVRDFVPCYRVYDGENGLLDIVNSVFYENAGTGEFLRGEEVSS